MEKLKLENFGVREMNAKEIIYIDGGKGPKGKIPWKKLWDWADKGLTALGVYEAIDEFAEGWNSVECKKK
ncbi:hypothetical protein [Daejeonella sp.]|uniref:hypothetical protein n=1 Tax=Daejeonella sp. TaxID=2805397 RepID=UPI0025C3C20B|nr:hypothetical protein [Daejeonella sp.]